MNSSVDRIAKDIARDIEFELERLGFLFRIFVRAKSENSIERKMEFKKYRETGKLMQDVIGVRITMYFTDDVPIVCNILKSKYKFVDETVDAPEETVFKPSRINLVFRLDDTRSSEFVEIVTSKYTCIDNTFEIQIRTVLSEGWHEVDHDLRYKCDEDWIGASDIARTFNGVYASLTTSDWSILTIFEQLAYRHYKNGNISAMLRSKFRLRFREIALDTILINTLEHDLVLRKRLFRVERSELINRIFNDMIRVPLTMSNLVFIINIYFLYDSRLFELTPEFILGAMSRDLAVQLYEQ